MADPKQIADALTQDQLLAQFNRDEASAEPWWRKGLPMEGRAILAPLRNTMEGSVFNQKELALPYPVAWLVNALTSGNRAYTGADPTFNPQEEAASFASGIMGGGVGASRMMKAPTGVGGKNLASNVYSGTGKGFSDEGTFRRVGANQPIGSEIRYAGDNPSGISGVIEGVGTGARGADPAEIAQANAEVKRLVANPDLNPAVQVAKQFNPNFDLSAVNRMPPSSIQKQFPIAKAYDLLTSELGIDPQLKRLMFAEYLKKYPEIVKKSDATTLSELTQAAYGQLRKENNQQFDALLNQGMNFSYHPGNANYTGSPEMLRDTLLNKHLYTFRGGDKHEFLNKVDPYLGLNDNEKFRAVHDVFGHGTTGASFGRMGEELAYGAHGQTYSPLAKMAAATETRGQNSFVNYSGLNTDLQRQMDVIRSKRELAQRNGQDTSLFDQQLQTLGDKWEYAKQSSVLLPAEMIDPMYKGNFPEYMKPYLNTQNPQAALGYHWSNKPDLTQTNPGLYGTGIRGAEAERLNMSGAPKERTYFYTNPNLREQGLGSNQYEANLSNLYDPTKDPEKLVSMASLYNKSMGIVDEASKANDWERMIKDAGYSGYVNPYSKTAITFEPQDVSKVKK